MNEKPFFQVIRERRSIRRFTDTAIDKTILNKIIDACDLCPSAGGLQSFEIYFIDKYETKKKIMQASLNQEAIMQAPVVLIFCANPTRPIKYGQKAKLFSIQDATIAATYAQLTATALGLSTVWIGAFEEDKISRILNLPNHLLPVTLLPIGYKNEEPDVKITRGVQEIFHNYENKL